jgi:hypothetical protein
VLVERVRAELGIDAEILATLVTDQAAAERARFPLPDHPDRRP